MPPKIAKLMGLGAFGAIAGMIAIYLFVAWLSAPSKTGGMMMSLSVVTWISLGIVILGMIASHVNLALQLLAIAKGKGAKPI